jgi:hypothetical protein
MEMTVTTEIIAAFVALAFLLLAVGGLVWRNGSQTGSIKTTLAQFRVALAEVKTRLQRIELEVTNHLPTQIRELDRRLKAHEEKEEVYWKIVEKHLSQE